MARRRQSFLDALIHLPWWVGVLVGVFGYAATTLVGPAIFAAALPSSPAFYLPRFIGYGFLLLCLVGAGASALRALFLRRKFDQQKTIDDIRKLTWQEFESIVGEAFRRRGYFVLENGGGGADGGVDLVLRREGKTFYVQCKQWRKWKIDVKAIREFFGVISARRVDGGFFVASGTYTKDAREFARECGIELIDGPALERMVLKVREAVDGRTIAEPYVASDLARLEVPPACPACGGQMVLRTAKRGPSAGEDFWGCSAYPKCRGTRAI